MTPFSFNYGNFIKFSISNRQIFALLDFKTRKTNIINDDQKKRERPKSMFGEVKNGGEKWNGKPAGSELQWKKRDHVTKSMGADF